MLDRIVYFSESVEPQTVESVDRILDISRSRNGGCGITGLLIGGASWWMQVLEGEASSLEPVWQSIRIDPRHSPVILVQRRKITRRSFPDWSMQYRREPEESFDASLEQWVGGIPEPRLRDQIARFSEVFAKPAAPVRNVASG